MSNKRDLKKTIRYMCGDLAVECLLAAEYLPDVDSDKMKSIVFQIADLQQHSLANCSVSFDKTAKNFDSVHDYRKAKKAYYNKTYKSFVAEYNNRVAQIVKEMNSLLSEQQRELNKKIANS